MARAGPRAVGGDRAAGGPGGGLSAGPWREGVPGQSQGPGPDAGSVPPERGQGRLVRCPGAGGLSADGSRPPDGTGAELGGGAGAEAADRGLSAPGAHANAAGESADGDAEGLLSAGLGRGGADDGPRRRLPAGVSDPRDADGADRAAVAAVGEGPPPERGADDGAVEQSEGAATAGAPACGPRQEPVDAGAGHGIDRGRGGGGELSAGGRRFFRDHAGGGVGPDAAGR